MKNGICTKCGAKDVYESSHKSSTRNGSMLSLFTSVRFVEYICCTCGCVETYMADMDDSEKVRDKCKKVVVTD